MLKTWDSLPDEMKTDAIKKYYDILSKKKCSLLFKRIFDIVASAILIIILSPLFMILALAIKIDSSGPVFFRQVRVTQYGKTYRIFKLRSMVTDADKIGPQVTTGKDPRITKVGAALRRFRLDEIAQCLDVFRGTMTFVGTRPEVPKYVEQYTPEMMATLLLPAGLTSQASIFYKDEGKLLDNAKNVDNTYINEVLPGKMHYNLKAIENFSFWSEIKVLFMTVLMLFGK